MAAVSVKRSIDKKKYYQWRTIYTYPHFFVFLSPISLQITLEKDADLGIFNKLRAAQFLLKIIHNDYFEAMWAVRLRTPVTPFMAPLKNYESSLVVDIEICTMDIIDNYFRTSAPFILYLWIPYYTFCFLKSPLNHQFCINVYFQMLLVLRTACIFPKEFEIVGGQE